MQDVAEPLSDEDGWERPDFFDRANCIDKAHIFIPSRGGNNRGDGANEGISSKAREICKECSVFEECFDYAMKIPAAFAGIYAGMSNKTRTIIRRELRDGRITREQAIQLSLSKINRSAG